MQNNLANVNTNGFKKDQVVFREYLSKSETDENHLGEIARSPIKDKDLYPLDGKDQSFVVVHGTHPTHSQGGLRVTDNPLDVAINGPGFFEVATPNGIRYTRSGSFKIGAEGRLVSSDGYPVLAKDDSAGNVVDAPPIPLTQGTSAPIARSPAAATADPASRFIQIGDRNSSIHINDSGEIYSGEDQIAKLSVVNFRDMNNVRKSGSLNFENKDPAMNPAMNEEQAIVKQGMIETSNVMRRRN